MQGSLLWHYIRMPASYSSTHIIGPYKLRFMSIHINCPNCHTTSSLTLSKLSAQVPTSDPRGYREHPGPAADLSDIAIESAMLLGLRHRERAQFQMARHGRGFHVPGHLVKPNNTGHLNLPIPQGQPQKVIWEGFGITTREKGRAQYAIHRAVQHAYEEGYKDAQKKRGYHYSFRKALNKADKEELDELKDRLGRESIGMTYSEIGDLTASQIRELLKEARRPSQRHQGGHKEEGDRVRRSKSRTRGHHPRSPHHNQENHWKRSEGICKCVHGCSEDSTPFESDEEGDYVYR